MTQAKNSMAYPTIHPVEMLQADNSPVKTNYEPSVKVNIGGTVTQEQFKFGTWYPIEGVPKDGQYFLFSAPGYPRPFIDWMSLDGLDQSFSIRQATHFMPLPPPPTNTKEEK